MKGLYGCFLLLLVFSFAIGQTTGDFRSFQSGDWNNVNTWERFNGSIWVNPAPSTPLNTSGIITIQSTHVITVTVGVLVDQCTVNGTLTVNSSVTLSVRNGIDPDLLITTGATLNNNGTIAIQNGFGNNALVQVNGVFNNTNSITGAATSRMSFGNGATYNHNTDAGTVPAATWNNASNCLITGTVSAAPTGLNQNFGNFTWNTPGLSNGLSLMGLTSASSFNGLFHIQDTGSDLLVLSDVPSTIVINNFQVSGTTSVAITDGSTVTLDIGGNFTYSSSSDSYFSNTGTGNIDLNGNFTFSGGTLSIFDPGGSGTITFDGSALQTFDNTGGGSFDLDNDANITIASFSELNMTGESFFNGSGTFTLSSDARLGVSSANGLSLSISQGNIRTASRNYSVSSNIRYIAGGSQTLGSEWGATGALNGVAVNLEINNGSIVTNTNVGSTNLVGIVRLTDGRFNIGGSNTLTIQSDFESTINGVFGGSATSNLTFSLTGTVDEINFASGAAVLNNFSIHRNVNIELGTDLAVNGLLSFTNNGTLEISGRTLTISGVNGDITATSGGFVSSSLDPGNLELGGVEALTSIPFSGSGNVLDNITFNRSGTSPSYSLTNSITINGDVFLTSGVLTAGTGALIMANGSTFNRSAGSMAGNSPVTVGSDSYNLIYTGSMTTGLELPISSTALDDIEVSGSVTLDKSITVNGTLLVSSGSLIAGTNTVNINGSLFTINSGTFTTSGPVNFTFDGTTVMGGTGIANTQFSNFTIDLGTTVSAPNANINISGTWANNGSFTANSSTVTFNGANQNIDPSGQSFNNVTFAGTATKTLLGLLDANGALVISSGATLDVGANNSINVAGTWSNSGTFVANSGTVIFDGTAQTITSNNQSFHNLTLANSGSKTLGGNIDINGDLTINSGVTFDASSSAFNINLAGNWVNNGSFNGRPGTGASVTFDGTTAITGSATTFNNITISGAVTGSTGTSNIQGNWLFSSGSFNANGGNINFNGSVSQLITPGGQSFHNVNISGGGSTKTLQGIVDINGNLTLSSGTFSVGANHQVNLAGDFSASGGSGLTSGTGLFVFDGTNQNITSGGKTFFDTQFSGSGTKTLLDAFDANGNMDIDVALAAGSNSINVGGHWDATGGSFTSTGLTTFDGTAQNIRSNGSAFSSLTLAGSSTKTLQDAIDANGNLTITSSTLDATASNFAVVVGGNWDSSLGTFTANTGTVTLDGTSQTIALGSNSFNNLTLNGSGTKTQQDLLDVNGNLTIASGLSSGSNNITLAGNWTNNGTYTAGTGTLVLNGGGVQSIGGSASATFNNITVSKAGGTATISTAQSITNALTMTGGTLNANGRLTLISNAIGDARIAEITGGSIIGEVIAQRFLPLGSTPPTGGVYRYMASPVTDAVVSDWQDDFPITGNFNDPSTASQWPGLGVTATARNMFFYNEAHVPTTTAEDRYESYPLISTSATASPLQNGRGYSARVRQTTPITLDVPGTPQQGAVPIVLSAQSAGGNDGWNLIGNPYAAPINWENVTLPGGVDTQINFKDNANNLGQSGGYVYYTKGSPELAIPISYTGTIASGQGFWVRTTVNGATITFQEDDKQAVSNPTFIRQKPLNDILRITVSGNDKQDELVIGFAENASDKVDHAYDAFKRTNDFVNLSSYSTDSVKMAINVLSRLSCNKEIGLNVENVTPGAYSLSFSQFENFTDNIGIKLLDNFTGATFVVTEADPVYEFNITTDAKTFGKNRFKVYFTFPTVETSLNVRGEDVCVGGNASIIIEDSQKGIKYYSTLNSDMVSEPVISQGGSLEITIPQHKLQAGENKIVLMASIGTCSPTPLEYPVIINAETTYPISEIKSNKNCGEGKVTLSVAGAPANGSYKWYETADASTAIAGTDQSVFITPELSKSKTYYVSAVNALGCEGERKAIVAEVVHVDPVSITMNEQELVSSYTTGNQWFFNGQPISNATGQSVEVTETGLYEVEVNVGGCATRAAREMIVLSAEQSLDNSMKFYPNPVQHKLEIELAEIAPASGVIRNSLGQQIGSINFEAEAAGMKGDFNFGDQASGLYLIRIFQGNVIIHKKIIKQ